MELSSTLKGWNDEKGFGFIVPQADAPHKTLKLSYGILFWLIVLLHQAFWADWLLLGRRFIPF